MGKIIKLTLRNWEKYNPRADRKNYSWLRLQNDYFDDPVIFELSSDAQRLHLFCMGLASKKGGETFELSVAQAAAKLRVTESAVLAAIELLSESGMVAADGVKIPAGVGVAAERHREVSKSLTTNERTDETNERTDETDGANGRDEPQPPPSGPDSSLESFLADTPAGAREAWNVAYGEALVREVLPRAWAGWLSDPTRQLAGGKAKYIRSWLENAAKDSKHAPRGSHQVRSATLEEIKSWEVDEAGAA